MYDNVLVTGGAGFVGRHICKRFTDLKCKVICIDNLISESSMIPENWPEHLICNPLYFTFINIDCREYFKSEEQERFDLIIHLAAIVGGRCSIENSPIDVGEDLSIDAEMFKWAIKNKPNKILFFSSSAAYPIKFQKDNDSKSKLSEDMIDFNSDTIGMADLTYGWAKLTGEYLAKLAHEKYGLNVVCYRPFSGYGEDQNVAYPFPSILTRVLNKESPIDIWSNSYRDFIYIEDAIDCVLDTINLINDGSAINIGTGVATSFKELAEKMCKICGHEVPINILSNKPSGVFYRVSNTSYSESLGFIPKTSLEIGIRRCANYLLKN
jgi:GDP-L-fucose synthase